MSIEFLIFLFIGAFAGGFISGLAGFGTSLFALGWWLQVMTPIEAVATVLVMSLVSGFQGILLVWRSIEWSILLRFLLPALIGIPIGLQLLSHLDSHFLTIVVALFLIVYGGFFSFKNQLPNLTRDTPVVDSFVGFVGGILGPVAGLSGALPTMLCSMRPWEKMKQRAVLQPYNFIIMALSATLLAVNGGYNQGTLRIIALSFPVTLLASIIGIAVFKRLSDSQFRRLLIGLMLLSGLILLIRAIFIQS